jgi:hypothetical protein
MVLMAAVENTVLVLGEQVVDRSKKQIARKLFYTFAQVFLLHSIFKCV